MISVWIDSNCKSLKIDYYGFADELYQKHAEYDAFLIHLACGAETSTGWMLTEGLRRAGNRAPIVLIDGSSELALQALNVQHIIGYCVKPLEEEQFIRVLNNLQKHLLLWKP